MDKIEKFAVETILTLIFIIGLICGLGFGLFIGTNQQPLVYNNTIIYNQTEFHIDTCKYEILEKEFEMYKQYSKQEFDNYRACKDGMIK